MLGLLGRDQRIERFNNNPLLRRLIYSSKSNGNAVLIIAWALPTGQILLVTDCFLGRVSESNLVQAHEPWLRIFGESTSAWVCSACVLGDLGVCCRRYLVCVSILQIRT